MAQVLYCHSVFHYRESMLLTLTSRVVCIILPPSLSLLSSPFLLLPLSLLSDCTVFCEADPSNHTCGSDGLWECVGAGLGLPVTCVHPL